ncbi:hypothetical protein N7468_000593 [Penicillium chermesinum]|uniref:Uncharacterized protein n=1 Tax=Penicillium chermesinum TaxID=63820 RepID=A0A9W9TYJ5_9EURO|nr:uncharacterized protein N7468_000593 [Penicillium chermesinum]KAJ5249142.1 hypothetical protein N7468_000593 [Penicillium chermesinum]KAJ6151240.1 hypothetical protein N7470_007834 [Penicillium chermesinum]
MDGAVGMHHQPRDLGVQTNGALTNVFGDLAIRVRRLRARAFGLISSGIGAGPIAGFLRFKDQQYNLGGARALEQGAKSSQAPAKPSNITIRRRKTRPPRNVSLGQRRDDHYLASYKPPPANHVFAHEPPQVLYRIHSLPIPAMSAPYLGLPWGTGVASGYRFC